MVDFSKPPCIYWSDSAKISSLQRRIIVWSILYYDYNENAVSDSEYDSVSRQLVELQKQVSKEDFEKSKYYYAMRDFDGSTGFDIPSKLTEKDRQYLKTIAENVCNQLRDKRRKGKTNDKTK